MYFIQNMKLKAIRNSYILAANKQKIAHNVKLKYKQSHLGYFISNNIFLISYQNNPAIDA